MAKRGIIHGEKCAAHISDDAYEWHVLVAFRLECLRLAKCDREQSRAPIDTLVDPVLQKSAENMTSFEIECWRRSCFSPAKTLSWVGCGGNEDNSR